jgi:hypothetical protein
VELKREPPGFSRIVLRTREEAIHSPDHRVGFVSRVPLYVSRDHFVPDNWSEEKTASLRADMECEATITLAGAVAEARVLHRSREALTATDTGCSNDLKYVERITGEFARGTDRDHLVNQLWERTAAYMRRPRVWSTVQTLADALIKCRDLSSEQALAIMLESWDRVDV